MYHPLALAGNASSGGGHSFNQRINQFVPQHSYLGGIGREPHDGMQLVRPTDADSADSFESTHAVVPERLLAGGGNVRRREISSGSHSLGLITKRRKTYGSAEDVSVPLQSQEYPELFMDGFVACSFPTSAPSGMMTSSHDWGFAAPILPSQPSLMSHPQHQHHQHQRPYLMNPLLSNTQQHRGSGVAGIDPNARPSERNSGAGQVLPNEIRPRDIPEWVVQYDPQTGSPHYVSTSTRERRKCLPGMIEGFPIGFTEMLNGLGGLESGNKYDGGTAVAAERLVSGEEPGGGVEGLLGGLLDDDADSRGLTGLDGATAEVVEGNGGGGAAGEEVHASRIGPSGARGARGGVESDLLDAYLKFD
ncbi:hypothetical protein HK097_003481 [Rhizophlyctis rosea]|uniref:Uncharacterized protein n=1 Tax=Rhizophlyctis rosea TaxID=64517 RepID=A0AAD5SI48_9FUNG|nr:hypothetical protein HK097_003481 [Rhizophlyctis rosea]